jgi:hypothetical protein
MATAAMLQRLAVLEPVLGDWWLSLLLAAGQSE